MVSQLFVVPKNGAALVLQSDRFKDEVGDLEAFLKANPSLLGDGVQIFAEQVNTGVGDRIDLLAIDTASETSELLLLELKNVRADVRVLLQALRYASWIMANPDSIRLLLERSAISSRLEDIRPTIIIVAPEIESELIEMSRYVSAFDFSFLEIQRFSLGDDRLVVVTKRGSETTSPPPGVSAQEDWSWEKYQIDLKVSPTRIEAGKKFVEQLLALVDKNG